MNSKTGVAAVDRALSILDAFNAAKPRMTLAELSQATGLYKSTILRLIGSLERFGYLRQLPNGSYQIGPKLAELATVFQDAFNIRDFVQPVLEELVDQTNEGASYFVRDGNQQVCIFRIDGRHPIRDHHIRVGDRWDLDRGATAKTFLAFEGKTGTDATLDNMIAKSIGEKQPDAAGIAVPVFGAENKLVGSLIVSGPRSRFDKAKVKELSSILIKQAARLSMSLGADLSHFQKLLQQMVEKEI